MTTTLKQGQKVKSVYGEILTVLEVRNMSVRTYEFPNDFYHVEKLITIK